MNINDIRKLPTDVQRYIINGIKADVQAHLTLLAELGEGISGPVKATSPKPEPHVGPGRKRGPLSPEAKAKIQEGQRKRWEAKRKADEAIAAATPPSAEAPSGSVVEAPEAPVAVSPTPPSGSIDPAALAAETTAVRGRLVRGSKKK